MRLVRPQWQRLHALARQYAATQADAGDLVQETLLRAWRSFRPTEDRTYSRGWLIVIMRHIAIEWHRRASARLRLVPLPEMELTDRWSDDPGRPLAPLPSMSEEAFREWLDEKLVRALDALDEPMREVLMLWAACDLTYREIADVLDCPIGTVMSRMARARKQLRARLSELAPRTPRRQETRP